MAYCKVLLSTGEDVEIEILEKTTVLDICKILSECEFFHDEESCVRTDNVIYFELMK